MPRSRYFQVDWVLIDAVAIGPAPRHARHLIDSTNWESKEFQLCSEEEHAPQTQSAPLRTRIRLPDHRAGRFPNLMNQGGFRAFE